MPAIKRDHAQKRHPKVRPAGSFGPMRDQAYREEIAVFRSLFEGIASTPEGASALARYNAGDERALAVLDDLNKARAKARQIRADIETAADLRAAAAMALDMRAKGMGVTTEQPIARLEEVTTLDPGVQWDWVELARLYQSAGRLSDARIAAQHAADIARSEHGRGVALNELGNVQKKQGTWPVR